MSDLKGIELTKRDTFMLAKPLCDKLDEQHTADMQKEVQQAAEQEPGLAVILDMSEVHFLPSLSIGALVSLMHDSKQRQQRFVLIGLQPEVRQTLAVCRLDKIFEIYDTVESASQRLGKST